MTINVCSNLCLLTSSLSKLSADRIMCSSFSTISAIDFPLHSKRCTNSINDYTRNITMHCFMNACTMKKQQKISS